MDNHDKCLIVPEMSVTLSFQNPQEFSITCLIKQVVCVSRIAILQYLDHSLLVLFYCLEIGHFMYLYISLFSFIL